MAAPPTVASPPAASADDFEPRRRAARRAASLPVLAVAALAAIGAVLRVIVAHQSVFADELSTYWISVTHGLGGVLSLLYSNGRIQHAEITPPLSFLASWLSTRPGATVELLRAPALLAGTATIPLVYALGLRSVGRRAALLAAALTALSPFMIYYSAEARAYGLMMFLLACSTLSMLLAIDTQRKRYWVLFAVFSAAAFYTHYTSAFVLAVQLLWLLWAEPQSRRQALIAIAGAAALVLPWIPGLVADFRSPTLTLLSALSLFTPHAVQVDIEHWAIGYPYAQSPTLPSVASGLRNLPGVPALVLLALALVVSVGGVADRVRRGGWPQQLRSARGRRVTLMFALMLATPVGEILGSAIGNHIIGVRDLAASWPYLALAAAAFAFAAGRRVGTAAAVLGLAAFALAAAKMLEARFQRPNYQAAASYVAAHARAGDVVIDETGGLSPGPLTGFDVAFRRHLTVVRALSPAERDHPFTVFDPIVSFPSAVSQAVKDAHGGRVFLVAAELPQTPFGDGYQLRTVRRYPGIERTLVGVYSRSAARAP
jgi:4-amino-4-deoxy-L-arabinose transferase-like glycosyltransferase